MLCVRTNRFQGRAIESLKASTTGSVTKLGRIMLCYCFDFYKNCPNKKPVMIKLLFTFSIKIFDFWFLYILRSVLLIKLTLLLPYNSGDLLFSCRNIEIVEPISPWKVRTQDAFWIAVIKYTRISGRWNKWENAEKVVVQRWLDLAKTINVTHFKSNEGVCLYDLKSSSYYLFISFNFLIYF